MTISKSAGEAKQIAKSLHTVTVIIQVARSLRRRDKREAIAEAMEILELAGRADPYGLEAKALRQWGAK